MLNLEIVYIQPKLSFRYLTLDNSETVKIKLTWKIDDNIVPRLTDMLGDL
jgi:hypothetical protein